MKIFGVFGVLSSAEEFKFDMSRLNDTSTRSSNIITLSNLMAEDYARFACKPDYNKREWNYGCWGQINEEEVQSGLGEPLDAIDRVFQSWKRCQECRNLDFGSSSLSDYFANMILDYDQKTMRFICNSEIDAYRARCQCDEALAFGIVQNFDVFNSDFELENGFDFEKICDLPSKNKWWIGINRRNKRHAGHSRHSQPRNSAGGDNGVCWRFKDGESQRKCCGDYPQRFPYDDKAGCMQCCNTWSQGARIYNVRKGECLGDVLSKGG